MEEYAFCIKKNKMSFAQFLPISELLAQKGIQMLSSYPPFKNENIREQIQKFCEPNSFKSNIDFFFSQLRIDIEETIQLAEKRAKQDLIQHEYSQRIVLNELNNIGEIDKLKGLLISGSEKINEFLKDKQKNAELNEISMQIMMNEIYNLIESIMKFSLFDISKNNNNNNINMFRNNITNNNINNINNNTNTNIITPLIIRNDF